MPVRLLITLRSKTPSAFCRQPLMQIKSAACDQGPIKMQDRRVQIAPHECGSSHRFEIRAHRSSPDHLPALHARHPPKPHREAVASRDPRPGLSTPFARPACGPKFRRPTPASVSSHSPVRFKSLNQRRDGLVGFRQREVLWFVMQSLCPSQRCLRCARRPNKS